MIKSLDGLCIHTDGKGITDPLFKHIIPHDINQEVLNFRAELDKETDADKDVARKTKALVDYAARSQRAINKNLWVPDTQFFTEFACDTLVNVQVKDLSGYMRVLNVLTKNLAESLPANHPILSRLTANQGKPWHASEFKEINMLYQKKLRSRRYIESLQEGQPTAPKRSRRKSARALQISVAAPVENINSLLLKLESEVSELEPLYTTVDLQASDGAGHKGLNKKKHKQIKDLEKEIAPGAVCLLGLLFKARASTLGGGLRENDHQTDILDQGIQADITISEPSTSTTGGIAYTIRFLKDWEYGITKHQGEALPLSYDGSDTFPFETSGDDNGKVTGSIRNRIMAVISFAHKHKLLAWINCKNPTAAAQKIDKWLSKQTWAIHADPECKITSHSFRKAGVSLAMAAGISIPNLTNWCHWRSLEMPWHYADQKYMAPKEWQDIFVWMKRRPAQLLWA